VQAHAADLRAEVHDLPRERRDALVEAVASDWRRAALAPPDAALCAYAEKLTREPRAMRLEDVQRLRAAGFGDLAIHDAIQVVAYFNYINRIADGVHVDLEPEMEPYPG
jgi:uncharacterized peroxidase-related enzyme